MSSASCRADGFQLIVAGALLSIALNPVLFGWVDPLEARLRVNPLMIATPGLASRATSPTCRADPDADGATPSPLRLHAVLCGYGQVGRLVARALERRGFTYVVISQQRAEVEALRARGIAALLGEASNIELLERAHVEHARVVIVASSDPHLNHLIVERAKAINPSVDFVVRTGSDEETAQLRAISPKVQTVLGQRELAVQIARYSLRRFGVNAAEAEAIAQGLRGRPIAPGRAAAVRVRMGSLQRTTSRRRAPGAGPPVGRWLTDGRGDGARGSASSGLKAVRRALLRSRAPRPRSRIAPRRGTSRARQAMRMATAVTATMMVEIALISGVTPNRICAVDVQRQRAAPDPGVEADDDEVVDAEREGDHPAGDDAGKMSGRVTCGRRPTPTRRGRATPPRGAGSGRPPVPGR